MFESATLKLTGWYLLITMVISLIFSALVYQSAVGEVTTRLERFGEDIPFFQTSDPRLLKNLQNLQASEASRNILTQLVYINAIILVSGGITSYILARRTLRPIKEAHEAQSRFTSDASHELRTPLAAMKTELEVALRDSSMSKSDMREILESNLEEVDKLTQLSHTLLALSKLDLGALDTEKLSLRTLTNEVIKRLKIPSSRIDLQVSTKNDVHIDGNKPSITELLTILIDNAIKYSPDDSVVTIRIGTRSKQGSFTISNAGQGISEKDLPHIFERFYRADNSRTNSAKNGYGLGLSLAKKIVELHNGELSASSAPNETTTFDVLLPLYKRHSKPSTAQ